MTVMLKPPSAQLPFVDANGRLLRPASIFFESVINIIQGAGGVLDVLTSTGATQGAVTQAVADVQAQAAQIAANFGSLIVQKPDASLPPTFRSPDPNPDLPRVAAPPGQATAILLAGGVRISTGVGTPNGVISGAVGDLYLRQDGGSSTTFWVKESGAATLTGWVAK